MSNQLKIVSAAVPELEDTLAPKLERLGEILGQIHDLDCAAATSERHPRWFGTEADREAVRVLVAEHRVLLERDAFSLAETVFAGQAARRARADRDVVDDLAQAPAAGRTRRGRACRMIGAARAILVALAVAAQGPVAVDTSSYRDGHARPRALAFNSDDGLLYVALSTSDEIAIVDPGPAARRGGRSAARRGRACAVFRRRSIALPGGGALVACRFDAGLRRLQAGARGGWRVRDLPAGAEAGARGLAVAPDGMFAYVASPASGGVKVVSLATGRVVQTLPTGLSPRACAWWRRRGGSLPAAAGQQLHRPHRHRARGRRQRPARRRDADHPHRRAGARHDRRAHAGVRRAAAADPRGPAADARARAGRGSGQRRHRVAGAAAARGRAAVRRSRAGEAHVRQPR